MPTPSTEDTTSPLARYRAFLREGRLAYQFSPAAGRAVFFPRLVCPFTGSTALEWRVSEGLGTVHATTVVHPREGAPYNVALIDVDEGFRMMSRVDAVAPEAVHIGLRVLLRVAEGAPDEGPQPAFVPAGADGEGEQP
ncbi:OB-fold domain-containing protein [Aquincola sp. MAHUQ-54]|uniref:OB-fold domain-containing protein n=1 Tax=Aquincola agrisoli TaxID=3119538 RepID=A0AAW9QKT4_9BURK